MSFKPLRFDQGKTMSLLMGTGQTLTKNNRCKYSSGYLVVGATGDDETEYIALETKTNSGADGAAECLVLPIDGTTQFEALVGATPSQASHVGNDYDYTDADTVNLSGTTDKAFHIDYIKSAADKIVVGRFNKPSVA